MQMTNKLPISLYDLLVKQQILQQILFFGGKSNISQNFHITTIHSFEQTKSDSFNEADVLALQTFLTVTHSAIHYHTDVRCILIYIHESTAYLSGLQISGLASNRQTDISLLCGIDIKITVMNHLPILLPKKIFFPNFSIQHIVIYFLYLMYSLASNCCCENTNLLV